MATLTHINPTQEDGIFPVIDYGLSHAVVAADAKVIFVSGQIGWDKDANLIGPGDLAAQVAQAHENIRNVLKKAGAAPKDVVRMTTYVVNYKPEDGEVIVAANKKFFGSDMPSAQTLLGIQSLFTPDMLVEVEVTAVI